MSQAPASSDPGETARRPGVFRRLYLWVLHWADTPYGTPALFLLAFAESSFFPVPPDVLQIALSVSKPRRSFYYAVIAGLGSVAGALFGWIIGYALWSVVDDFFFRYVPGFTETHFADVSGFYNDNAFLAILGAAFTPIPFKVFTITAGACKIPLVVLLVASSLGRFGRFLAVAACVFIFGPSVKGVLEKHFGWATLVFFLALVGGFFAIPYVIAALRSVF